MNRKIVTLMKQKNKIRINAQLLYVIAIAWYVGAVGCFTRGVGMMGAIAAGVGTLHFVWAIVQDRKENNPPK